MILLLTYCPYGYLLVEGPWEIAMNRFCADTINHFGSNVVFE